MVNRVTVAGVVLGAVILVSCQSAQERHAPLTADQRHQRNMALIAAGNNMMIAAQPQQRIVTTNCRQVGIQTVCQSY